MRWRRRAATAAVATLHAPATAESGTDRAQRARWPSLNAGQGTQTGQVQQVQATAGAADQATLAQMTQHP